MRTKEPVAILCADLHLTLRRPACRLDKDWMEVQADYLSQLRNLQVIGDRKDVIPVLCAGDIFDRWNVAPELICFALEHLPDEMICVPGQHDLPNHRTEEMYRSAYGVLVQAGKIVDVGSRSYEVGSHLWIHGYGWERDITPLKGRPKNVIQLALIHQFIWTVDTGYPGAPESQHLQKFMRVLKGYDVAVFGDNHIAFSKKLKTDTLVWNCGGFIRRRADENLRRPRVGILFNDGSVVEHRLNTSRDKFAPKTELPEELERDMKRFLEQLEKLGEHGLDFREAVCRQLDTLDVDPEVRELVLSTLSD